MTETLTTKPETEPQSDPSSKGEKPVFSWFIDKLAAPLLMLLIGTLLGSWWNSSAPYLRYSVGEVNQFSSDREEFGLFYVRITNDGQKRVEQVQCEIELGESRIQDLKAGPSILEPLVKMENDGKRATITFPTLNPTEVLDLTIKASKPDQILKTRRISVRGHDVVGIQGAKPETGWIHAVVYLLLAITYFILIGPLMFKSFDFLAAANHAFTRYFDKRRPKKRFHVTSGTSDGHFISDQEATALYNCITMQGTRVEYNGSVYKVGGRRIDDDGTLEFTLSTYYW